MKALLPGVTLLAVLLLLSSQLLLADTKSQQDPSHDTNLKFQDILKKKFIPICDEPEKPKETYFRAYKSNYLLPAIWTFNELEDREGTEIKFQISMQQSLLTISGYTINLGYTQKSFWQAYHQEDSSPFRETNYNPEFFVRSPVFRNEFGQFTGYLGYEHESNGEVLPVSRSWDRIYTRVIFEFHPFNINYKLWYRLPEPQKEDSLDPKGDDNPDIHHYYGYSELSVTYKNGRHEFSIFSRLNAVQKKGAIQLDYTGPMPGKSINYYFQYWNGYGESLIDYDRRLTKFGIGLLIKN